MTHDDHDAFAAMAQKMASLNGYHAMQGSQMYIYDGDFVDWACGDQHIFALHLGAVSQVGLWLRWFQSARFGHRSRDEPQHGRRAVPLRAGRLPVSRGGPGRNVLP